MNEQTTTFTVVNNIRVCVESQVQHSRWPWQFRF